MTILVNGQERTAAEGETIASLLENLGIDARRIAVERNGEIVRRGRFADTALADGDRLELVHFVGGG